ncbi:hypothetical protein HNY73_015167 [Argiope bruennichi]|uniref:Uncharacterized protein n=1 Tax=Argiope bruennichi TaxID=94029 RepID=A0A8T0ER91_ARGBR|nr:hypothetical protein HNY73_015167 [Argiope bruennichi]
MELSDPKIRAYGVIRQVSDLMELSDPKINANGAINPRWSYQILIELSDPNGAIISKDQSLMELSDPISGDYQIQRSSLMELSRS